VVFFSKYFLLEVNECKGEVCTCGGEISKSIDFDISVVLFPKESTYLWSPFPRCFPDRIGTPSKEMWRSLDYQMVKFGRGKL